MKINIIRNFTILEIDNYLLIYVFKFLSMLFIKVIITFMLNDLIISSLLIINK